MNRPFYSEYVKHMLRFYSRYPSKPQHFKSIADELNWETCHSVLETHCDRDVDLFISIYGGFDSLSEEVKKASEKHRISQHFIWDMMKELEYRIANIRGLI